MTPILSLRSSSFRGRGIAEPGIHVQDEGWIPDRRCATSGMTAIFEPQKIVISGPRNRGTWNPCTGRGPDSGSPLRDVRNDAHFDPQKFDISGRGIAEPGIHVQGEGWNPDRRCATSEMTAI